MSVYKRMATPGKTDWFVEDRFGMFIHFGYYAMLANSEWVKTVEEIDDEKYNKYFNYFNPDLFDAKEWAKTAKEAGMKYVVLTTKHHDGFCLFDTKYTDYKITNTPFKRDLVKEYVEAVRAEGLKVGFYYSLIDWHHPDFPIDVAHPLREAPNAEELDRGRDVKKYAEYMRNQVTELLTNYGKIDVLWFDFSYPNPTPEYIKRMFAFAKHANANPKKPWMQFGGAKGPEQWESEKLISLVRSIAPDIIINNRTGIPQDTVTPEQNQPTEWVRDKNTGEYLTWEVCHTLSGGWGYNKYRHDWKSPKMLIDSLIKTVAFGGNLIMNVGPTARGNIDKRTLDSIAVYAEWMKYNSRSIYGCTMADPEFEAPRGTYLTESNDGKRLYIHLTEYPFKYIEVKNLVGKIAYAQYLFDASEATYTELENGNVKIDIQVVPPHEIDPVIEVFLK